MDGFEIVLGALRTERQASPRASASERTSTSRRAATAERPPERALRVVDGNVRSLATARAAKEPPPVSRRGPGIASTRGPGETRAVREAIDIFVGGVNVTARVDADQASCVVRDLAHAVVDLACGVRRRAIVRFYDAPWELGLERIDDADAPTTLALSVLRNGPDAEIAVFDRRVAIAEVVAGTAAALDLLAQSGRADAALEGELAAARDTLRGLAKSPIAPMRPTREVAAIVEAEPGLRVAFSCELPLRVSDSEDEAKADRGVEASDLHSLLGRGRLRASVRGRTKELGDVHAFLVAERLVALGKQVLDAWERGKPLHVRTDVAGPMMGVRLEPAGELTLSLVAAPGTASDEPPSQRGAVTFPSLEGPDLVDAAVSFGRALVRAVLRRDRAQVANLRLMALRRKVKELSDRLRDVARPVGPFGESDLVNTRRDSYRPYLAASRAAVTSSAGAAPTPRVPSAPPVRKMRFSPRWTAEVPGIDLRATFLCGDRLVLSGAAQTACVARDDGSPLWKVPTVRATTLPTAFGLARLRGDGRLELRDFGDGSVTWSQPCAPRSRGTPAACTVVSPGLPRLLVATDGDRHLVAFDLTSGEPRWRYAMARPGSIRIRRAGRLLIVASDEAQLVAIDALDGHVVWRLRDRLRFAAPPSTEREELFAVAGEPQGMARLHVIDVLSGARRWERQLEASIATESAPMILGRTILLATRDRRGLGMIALDRTSGVERWSAPTGAWPVGTSALPLDDVLVLNLPTGEVCAISAETGETVWRHVFDAPFLGDAPRRLEPVLRSGALFVPQDKVRVLRPSDGAVVGIVEPCDLVPDLLRVDERCDVYVGEESGHISAFGASAKLELVRV
jgi:outer membrane protein assembly factor BamB